MDYVIRSKKIDSLISEMKANYFDVDNVRQRHMNIIEGLISNTQSEERELELQQLWADYHEAEKQCRLAANRMISAMQQLDYCFQNYHKKIYQVESSKKVPSNNIDNEKQNVSNEVDESKEESVTQASVVASEVNSSSAAEDNFTAETLPTVEEGPAEVTLPAVEKGPAEVTLPAVEEGPVVEESSKEVITPVSVVETPSDGLVSAVVNDSSNNEMVFAKTTSDEAKAIVINANQKNKLANSLATQKSLIDGKLLPTENQDTSSEQQVEQLMNQLPALYEQGKVEEAEKVSEQIRVLNKDLSSAA